MTAGNPDIAQLRQLLFGKEYNELLALKAQFAHSERYSVSVAQVITEALQYREAQDQSLSQWLAPTVEQTLTQTITQQPKHFADILYPVMGPAIRKSIQQALQEALDNFNQLLEHSLSWRAWHWRWLAWRTGQSYAQIALLHSLVYQVEQVFLIERNSGLLLNHIVADETINRDPTIISGMLTAIQDFVTDSFATEAQNTLQTLRLRDNSIVIEQGPFAVLAVVIRGIAPATLPNTLQQLNETIHAQYTVALQHFSGDSAVFASTTPLLQSLLQQPTASRPRATPWLAIGLLSSLMGALAYSVYVNQQGQRQQQQQLQQALQQLQQEPGLVVLGSHPTANGYRIQGLADPLARLPQQVVTAQLQQALQLQWDFQSFWSAEPSFASQRLRPTVDLSAQQQQLAQHIDQLVQSIQSARYDFALNSAAVISTPDFQQLVQQILDLIQLVKRNQQWLQLTIIASTDPLGAEPYNQQLATQRAQAMQAALIANGIPAFILQTQTTQDAPRERTTRYRLTLY